MDTNQRLIRITASPWRWLRHCWLLRSAVQEAVIELVTVRCRLKEREAEVSAKDLQLEKAQQAARAMARFIKTRHGASLSLAPEIFANTKLPKVP